MKVAGMIFRFLPRVFPFLCLLPVSSAMAVHNRQASRWLAACPPAPHLNVFNELLREVTALPQADRLETFVSKKADSQVMEKKARDVLLRHFTGDELRFMADRRRELPGSTEMVMGFTGQKEKVCKTAVSEKSRRGQKVVGGKGTRRALVAVETRRGGATNGRLISSEPPVLSCGRGLMALPRNPPRWLSFFRGGVGENTPMPLAEIV